jgi:hypothetical protein
MAKGWILPMCSEGHMTEWTTRLEPDFTRQFGVDEIHTLCFAPPNWEGKGGQTISLGIPECEMHYCIVDNDGAPTALVNRPAKNKDVRYWTRAACVNAKKDAAFLLINCDTAEQAAVAARRIAKLLPQYRRIALERMYDPRTRARSSLS